MTPIQTSYRGYLFRSRLEARWAVFFDSLGIRWNYEPEGYHLSSGDMYLPDFHLPNFCGMDGIFVEVKPELGIDRKARQLAMDSGIPVLMACGIPSARVYTLLDYHNASEHATEQSVCFDSKYLRQQEVGDGYRLFYFPGYENDDGTIDEQFIDSAVLAAIKRARSSRFEHGQEGAVAA